MMLWGGNLGKGSKSGQNSLSSAREGRQTWDVCIFNVYIHINGAACGGLRWLALAFLEE